MRKNEARTLRGRRTGSGLLRRMKNGRRNSRGRRGERILSFMVRCRPLVCLRFHVHDFSPDDAHAARRKYKKEVDKLKPDLEAYNKQKETAMGLAPGTLSQSGSSSFSLDGFDPSAASSSQVTHLVFPMPLTNSESVLSDGSNRLPARGGSRGPLSGRE
jgi:SYF2 splicing factor